MNIISTFGLISIIAIGISISFMINFAQLTKYRKPLDIAIHNILDSPGIPAPALLEEYNRLLQAYTDYVNTPKGAITAAILGMDMPNDILLEDLFYESAEYEDQEMDA